VIRIRDSDAKWVCKDRRGFLKFDAVFLAILLGLSLVPFEFHNSSVPALGSARLEWGRMLLWLANDSTLSRKRRERPPQRTVTATRRLAGAALC
jgi:hypothetical protein